MRTSLPIQLLEEAVQSENKEETKEEIDIGKGKDNEQNKEEPKEENPLEKYMKMVLEARGKQQEKVSSNHRCESLTFNVCVTQTSLLFFVFRPL